MVAYAVPFVRPFYVNSTGTPLAGGKVYFYQAGTSTALATYTDQTGVTQNANPVVLDSAGRASIWLGTGSYKVVLKDSSDVTVWTEDGVSGVGVAGAVATASEWLVFSNTVTYSSATVFTTAGNQTATLHVGRRLKAVVNAGTIYGTIQTSVFGALTTVTCVWDGAGALDVGLSALSYGLNSYDNQSFLEPRSAVSVRMNASQTITSGAAQKIQFNTKDVDSLVEWSTSNYNFTAKFTGNYIVLCQVSVSGNPTGGVVSGTLYLLKNGVSSNVSYPYTVSPPSNTTPIVSINNVVSLLVGDVIDIRGQANAAGTFDVSGVTTSSFVSIARIA